MVMKPCQYVIEYGLVNGVNIALAAEVLILLDLVDSVVQNVTGSEEGKILMHMDCRKVWGLLTSKTFKGCQLIGDGGSIISKIVGLKKKEKTK